MADTTVLLTASMTKPWDILNSLEKWTKVLEEHIKKLSLKPETLQHFKHQSISQNLTFIQIF